MIAKQFLAHLSKNTFSHFSDFDVGVQPQWVCPFQGRGVWIRDVRQNKQRYKRDTETEESTGNAAQ